MRVNGNAGLDLITSRTEWARLNVHSGLKRRASAWLFRDECDGLRLSGFPSVAAVHRLGVMARYGQAQVSVSNSIKMIVTMRARSA